MTDERVGGVCSVQHLSTCWQSAGSALALDSLMIPVKYYNRHHGHGFYSCSTAMALAAASFSGSHSDGIVDY